MSRVVARLLAARLAIVAAAVTLFVVAPRSQPQPHLNVVSALALGALCGSLLYAVLARRVHPPPLTRPAVVRRLSMLAPRLAFGAAGEELLWRYVLWGVLQTAVGLAASFVATTFGFAAAHARFGLRTVTVHLVTGSAFAATYVATGRLAAAIAAHLTYNVLVVAASVDWAEKQRDAVAA